MIYLDNIGIKFLISELNDKLVNSKVNKIYQYDENSFSIFLGKRQLFFQIKDKDSIVYIKEKKDENLNYSSNFLLLLRKHLTNAILSKIENINNDRIIKFIFKKISLSGNIDTFYLIFEIMDRHSNIFLLNEDNMIINVLKNNTSIENSRIYFINSKYEVFSSDKKELNFDKIYENPEQMIKEVFGIGKIFANDCFDNINLREKYSKDYEALIFNKDNKTYLTYNNFKTFNDFKMYKFENLNEAINEYFDAFCSNSLVFNMKNKLNKYIQGLIKKNVKIIKNINLDIKNNENYELLRKKADLFAANIYLAKDKIDHIIVKDYETNEDVLIKLNDKKTKKENLNLLYTKYKKSKKAYEFAKDRLIDIEEYLKYLEDTLEYIDKENDIIGLLQIEEEFSFSSTNKKTNKIKKRDLLKYTIDEFEIFVGRNHKENNYLTFEKAKAHDIWLHVQDLPGSHVIIVTNKKQVPEKVILEAAKLAALHSKGTSKKTINYTQRANVKRKNSYGQVTFNNFKSVLV